MSNTIPPSAGRRRRTLTPAAISEILWDCAWEAAILAFMIQIMGGAVVGSVSWLWRDMTPSLPPVLSSKPAAERDDAAAPWDFSWFHKHRFAILFAIVFAGNAWGRLARYSGNEDHRKAAAWMRRVSRRVSEEWFSLVVMNALTAFVGVMVLRFTQQFTLTHLVWQAISAVLRPVIDGIAQLVPAGGLIEGLVGWYNDNQFKFAFWLLYSAAICDDLGLPNYKTLGRMLWQRWLQGKAKTPAPPAATEKSSAPVLDRPKQS